MHTYIHTYVHTYIQTYIHAYIHIYALPDGKIMSNWKYTGVWCLGPSPGYHWIYQDEKNMHFSPISIDDNERFPPFNLLSPYIAIIIIVINIISIIQFFTIIKVIIIIIIISLIFSSLLSIFDMYLPEALHVINLIFCILLSFVADVN